MKISTLSVVPSGIVQGYLLGPTLEVIDSMLGKLSYPIPKKLSAFAADLKFITKIDEYSSKSPRCHHNCL